jgi:hypothetical protein
MTSAEDIRDFFHEGYSDHYTLAYGLAAIVERLDALISQKPKNVYMVDPDDPEALRKILEGEK